MDYLGHGLGMGFGMWIIPILFLLLLFYLLKENSKTKEEHPSAQDILDKRYANGEIDTKEYEERTNALNKK